MHRIFPILVLLAVAFFVATAGIGLFLGDKTAPDLGQQWFTVHLLLGITTSLVVMFVNGVVVTYFIGTSRWCREVVDAYSLPGELARASHQLKRRAFPYSLGNMLLIIGLVALGGAADVHRTAPGLAGLSWSQWHLLGALLALAFMALATVVQWTNIRAHQAVIADILDRVRAIRAEKGLD